MLVSIVFTRHFRSDGIDGKCEPHQEGKDREAEDIDTGGHPMGYLGVLAGTLVQSE